MAIRAIKITVGNKVESYGVLKSYPVDDLINYKMPIYSMTVEGTDDAGKNQSRVFSIFRFGVHKPTGKSAATVVGLADEQTHVIKKYKHDYELHSVGSAENGAWVVWKTFYIHDGADDPKADAYGTIGCVEVVGESQSFLKFNEYIVSLSGATGKTRDEKLIAVGKAAKITIIYKKCARPPLVIQTP